MIATVIGIGLIGGSMALDLRKAGMVSKIIGVDRNADHLAEAVSLGIIDEFADLADAIEQSDLILIAIPVDAARQLLPEVLDLLQEGQTVIDLGSSKAGICAVAKDHRKRKQYVACHPIAGTEFSGPSAAFHGLYADKVNIICNKEESSNEAVAVAQKVFEAVGMNIIYMDADEHDRHIAYVSHLSHVTSFTLGLTVLDIEKDEKNIFNMAGSGFASTVRLAKSSADMWAPIFEQNSENLLEAMDAYIEKLQLFREVIKEKKTDQAHQLIKSGNEIKRILEGIELKNKAK